MRRLSFVVQQVALAESLKLQTEWDDDSVPLFIKQKRGYLNFLFSQKNTQVFLYLFIKFHIHIKRE